MEVSVESLKGFWHNVILTCLHSPVVVCRSHPSSDLLAGVFEVMWGWQAYQWYPLGVTLVFSNFISGQLWEKPFPVVWDRMSSVPELLKQRWFFTQCCCTAHNKAAECFNFSFVGGWPPCVGYAWCCCAFFFLQTCTNTKMNTFLAYLC